MTPPVKTCFKCGQEKPITEFYKHPKMGDGYLGKCKECTKADSRANRSAKIDYYREYDRKRGSRMTNDDLIRQRARHPEWVKAHRAVRNALINGTLKKKPCEICGASFVHAHHPDYSKPLEVIWLCPLHHRQVHTQSAA